MNSSKIADFLENIANWCTNVEEVLTRNRFEAEDDVSFGSLGNIAWVFEKAWGSEFDWDYSSGEITGEQVERSPDKGFDKFLIVFNLEIYEYTNRFEERSDKF